MDPSDHRRNTFSEHADTSITPPRGVQESAIH